MVESIVTRRSRKDLGVGLLFFKVAVAVRIQIWSSAKWLSQCGLSSQSSSQWRFESSQCGLSSQSCSQWRFESFQFGLSSQSCWQWSFESFQFGLSSQSCWQWRFESSEFVHPFLGLLNLMTCFDQIWYVVSTLDGVSQKQKKTVLLFFSVSITGSESLTKRCKCCALLLLLLFVQNGTSKVMATLVVVDEACSFPHFMIPVIAFLMLS